MQLHTIRVVAPLVLGVALSDCGGGSGGSATTPAASVDVELGTGTQSFEPLSDGQSVDIVGGPQGGGFRITTALRVHAPQAGGAMVTLSARLKDTGAALDEPITRVVDLVSTAPGVWEKAGLPDFITDPTTVHQKAIVIQAEVMIGGSRGSDEKTVVPN
jgi:hypothetical protein